MQKGSTLPGGAFDFTDDQQRSAVLLTPFRFLTPRAFGYWSKVGFVFIQHAGFVIINNGKLI